MLNFHDKMGAVSGKSRPFYKSGEVDQMCIEELIRYNLLPTEPESIRIDRYVEKRFGICHEYEALPDGVMGYTVFGTSGVEKIILNSALENGQTAVDERRLRTTLAHEAGHGLLHAHLFTSNLKKPHFSATDNTDSEGYQGKWWEYQANMAMGSLLLPKSMFLQQLRKTCNAGLLDDTPSLEQVSISSINELSEVFNVNPIVVKIRLRSIQ
jgi:hypothetical protein